MAKVTANRIPNESGDNDTLWECDFIAGYHKFLQKAWRRYRHQTVQR